MIEKRFSQLTQGKKPHMRDFLVEIHLQGIRGMTSA